MCKAMIVFKTSDIRQQRTETPKTWETYKGVHLQPGESIQTTGHEEENQASPTPCTDTEILRKPSHYNSQGRVLQRRELPREFQRSPEVPLQAFGREPTDARYEETTLTPCWGKKPS